MEREQSGGGTIKCENRRTEKWTNGKTKGKKIIYDKRSKKKITKARQYATQIWVYKIYVRKKRKKKEIKKEHVSSYPSAGSHGMFSDALMKNLTVTSSLYTLHEDDFSCHEGKFKIQMSSDDCWPYLMLCYVILCYVILCYVMLCHVMSCYIMLCYALLCHVM